MCISRNPGDISAVCSLSTWMFISRNHEDISAECSLSRRDNKMFKRHSCCPFCPVFLMLSFLFQMHNARFPGLLILQTKVFYGNDNLEDTCVSTIYFVIYQLSIRSPSTMQWLVGLGVWFSLRVREVPGSNPGRALRTALCWNMEFSLADLECVKCHIKKHIPKAENRNPQWSLEIAMPAECYNFMLSAPPCWEQTKSVAL